MSKDDANLSNSTSIETAKPKRKLAFSNRTPKHQPDLATIYKKLLVALNRSSTHLMFKAIEGSLNQTDGGNLNNFLKTVNQLRKDEKGSSEQLSEEELAAQAAKADK